MADDDRPHVRVVRGAEIQEADRLAALLEDDTGHIDEMALDSGLATWLVKHPEYCPVGTRARQIREQWKRARKPRFSPSVAQQRSFYQPNAILVLGEAGIVRMGKCSLDEFDKWWNIQLQEKIDQDLAHLAKSQYHQQRRSNWDTRRYSDLDELEKDVFGWVEPAEEDTGEDEAADDLD